MENNDSSIFINDLHGYNVLCPNCFKEVKPNVINGLKVYDMDDWIQLVYDLPDLKARAKMPCGCVMSYEDYLSSWIYIDELISRPVSAINRAGYRTAYCCSGHIKHGNGYLSFKEKYDDLIDYIVNGPLINILDVDITMLEKNKFFTYSYDKSTKTYKRVRGHTKEECSSWAVDHFCIYMGGMRKKSRLDRMLMFRKVLNTIAKWCRTTKEFNERINLGNQIAKKYGFERRKK